MRRFMGMGLILALGCAAPGGEVPGAAPELVGLSSEKLRRIDPLIRTMIDQKKIAGEVIVVAKDGQVAYLESWGKMDLEAGKAMRPDTIFRLYSMTKAIVTTAARVGLRSTSLTAGFIR